MCYPLHLNIVPSQKMHMGSLCQLDSLSDYVDFYLMEHNLATTLFSEWAWGQGE